MTHSLVCEHSFSLSSGGQQRTGSVDSTRRHVEPKQENLPSPVVWCMLSENIYQNVKLTSKRIKMIQIATCSKSLLFIEGWDTQRFGPM